jgi:RNA polymerase sigma-32 factor
MTNGGNGAMAAFLGNLKSRPVLERDEEQRLALHYQKTGDPATARKLVEGHLRLVVKIARSCCFRSTSLPDLIQEGNLGLMKAVTKFDPGRGVRLSTYAAWWIRAYIYQYVMDNARMMRVVTTFPQRKLFFALRKEEARLTAAGEPVDPAVLAKRLGVSVKDVVDMQTRLEGDGVDLDLSAIDQSGRGASVEGPMAADEAMAAGELRRAVSLTMEALQDVLDEREKLIIKERLTADEPMTLQEIGRRCGVSRERARQLEQRLKKQLHPYFAPLADELNQGAEAA